MIHEKLNEIRELEKTLGYLISPEMTVDEKIKSLSDSFWRSHNSGYCDYMAGQCMAGIENGQTRQHDLDCKYKNEVDCLIDLLQELKKEEEEDLWRKASALFDEDNEAGYRAWLALCERGNAHAAHSVGWCFRNGNGVGQDISKAEKYYRLAVERGYSKSYASLYGLCEENGNAEAAMNYLYEGARRDAACCYEILSDLCNTGAIYGGNSRVSAYLACRAYELDKKYGSTLALYYLQGTFFPKVYPYAKYCLENSYMTREEFEEAGIEFPDYWDEMKPMEPQYPAFGLTLDTCEGAVDPDALLQKAKDLMFADTPDNEAARPYVLEAAKAGSSQAMYYTYLANVEGWQEFLVKGADEYGDLDCIELLAALFSEQATYRIGNPFVTQAIKYWVRRKSLHGDIPISSCHEESYQIYDRGLDKIIGRKTPVEDPDANAVLLRADGSHEKIKVDFDSLEGLYAPLGCDRLNAISTQRLRDLSERLGFTVVMYCDERGMQKDLPENDTAAALSGYDVIWGDVVICGFKKDYAPLYKDEIEEVCELLEGR